MLAGERQLLALVGDLAEQPCVLDRQYRLARQGLHQLHRFRRKFPGCPLLEQKRAEDPFGADQRHHQHGAEAGGEHYVAQRKARSFGEIGELDR